MRSRFTQRAGLNATGVAVVALVLMAVALLGLVTGTSPHGKALAPSKPERANAAVSVGPGPLATVLRARPYQLQLRLTPNRAAVPGTISVELLKGGRPVNGARVRLTLSMLDMDMGHPTGILPQTAPGHYSHAWPALGMSGRYRLRFDIALPGATPSSLSVVDRIGA